MRRGRADHSWTSTTRVGIQCHTTWTRRRPCLWAPRHRLIRLPGGFDRISGEDGGARVASRGAGRWYALDQRVLGSRSHPWSSRKRATRACWRSRGPEANVRRLCSAPEPFGVDAPPASPATLWLSRPRRCIGSVRFLETFALLRRNRACEEVQDVRPPARSHLRPEGPLGDAIVTSRSPSDADISRLGGGTAPTSPNHTCPSGSRLHVADPGSSVASPVAEVPRSVALLARALGKLVARQSAVAAQSWNVSTSADPASAMTAMSTSAEKRSAKPSPAPTETCGS